MSNLSPSHYQTASGYQAWDVGESYRLGHHLSTALEYILRAGRKTNDPREDLGKAIVWLHRAAHHGRDLCHGVTADASRPSTTQICQDFGLPLPLCLAVGVILRPLPSSGDALTAAQYVQVAIQDWEESRALARQAAILDEDVAA